MDSTIEKEGNSLPHNTTEEVGKILQSFVEQFPHDKLGYYPEHDLPSRHHPETGECISCPIQGSYTEDIYWFMEKKLKAECKSFKSINFNTDGILFSIDRNELNKAKEGLS